MNAVIRGPIPPTPTNADRLREYRNRAEPVIGNLRDELVRWYGLDAGFVHAQSDESVELLYAEQYAYEQMKDGRIK